MKHHLNKIKPESKWVDSNPIPLLNCIKEKRKVFIDYKSFRENKTKNYEVHPKLLREYDSRWYLIGYVPDRKLHLTFGLERIVDAIYTEQRIDSDVHFDAMAFFRFSIGITETKGNTKAEKITLRMKPIPGRLLKTQPLHNSQKVTKETDEYTLIGHVVLKLNVLIEIFFIMA